MDTNFIHKGEHEDEREKILSLTLACLLALLCTACGGNGGSGGSGGSGQTGQTQTDTPPQAENVEPITIITTTSAVPGGTNQMLQESITEVFNEKGNGWFNFEHYDSATLYKSDAEFGALTNGDVDMAFLSSSWFYDNGADWISMYDTGYMYKDYDHMKQVFDLDGETGAYLSNRIWDEFHIKTFGANYLGVRHVWLRDKNMIVNTPEDLKGIKLRMPNSASWMFLGSALGAEPTPMDSSEVYLGLQTGTIDAQENIILSTWSSGSYEACETVALTGHLYSSCIISMNGDTWEKMTAEQQELFAQLMAEAIELNNEKVLTAEADVMKQVEELGIVIQNPDIDAFRNHVLDCYLADESISGSWDLEQLDKINAMVS